jgi:hypothetical protein
MGVKDGAFHPMLRFLMNLYETAFSGPLHYAIKNFDMPYLMSLYFLDKERKEGFSLSKDGRYRDISRKIVADRMKIYPPVYFSPLTTRGERMAVSYFGSETCMCHHFAATWREEIKERFPTLGFTPDRPEWTLKPAQVKKIESFLNAVIPYGSPQYKLLKKK